MATNNSNNNQYTNNADGFSLAGGTTQRTLTATGSNITLTGAGSNTYTMPSATDTLVGRASTDTLTNKTIDANGTGNVISNVASLSVKRQNDTTNSTVNGARIETGWGIIAYNTGTNTISETVTFGTVFTTAPIVTVTFGGDSAAGTTYGSGGNNVEGPMSIKATTVGTSSFAVYLNKPSGANFAAGNAFYQWIAVGV